MLNLPALAGSDSDQMWIAKQLSDYDYPINGLPAFTQGLPDIE